MRDDRRLCPMHGNQQHLVRGNERRLQHNDQRVRPVPDERDLFGLEANLCDGDEHLPWLHGCCRLLSVLRAHGMRVDWCLRSVHRQQHVLGDDADLRNVDEHVPQVLRRQRMFGHRSRRVYG
jgi:hypothetical protein